MCHELALKGECAENQPASILAPKHEEGANTPCCIIPKGALEAGCYHNGAAAVGKPCNPRGKTK